jgi:anti-sigma B factor antagonist
VNPGVLKIACRLDGVSLELVLSGEIDLHSCSQLSTCLDAVPPACQEVIVDLAGVTFMDSSGLHALHECRRALVSQDCALRVRNPSDAVRQVFDLTGMADYFGLEPASAVPNPASSAGIRSSA